MLNIHSRNPLDFIAILVNRKKFIRNAISILQKNGIKQENDARVVAKVLQTYYDAHDRFYHTTAHINLMLDYAHLYFRNDKGESSLEPSELLAILFHDAVYRPNGTDNEELSIDLMVALMSSYNVHLTEFCWSSRCIRETSNHLKTVADESTYAVLDLDLVGMAGSYESFKAASDLIMKEYPDKTELDRVVFLKRLMDKPKLFYRLPWLDREVRMNVDIYIKEIEKTQTDKKSREPHKS